MRNVTNFLRTYFLAKVDVELRQTLNSQYDREIQMNGMLIMNNRIMYVILCRCIYWKVLAGLFNVILIIKSFTYVK